MTGHSLGERYAAACRPTDSVVTIEDLSSSSSSRSKVTVGWLPLRSSLHCGSLPFSSAAAASLQRVWVHVQHGAEDGRGTLACKPPKPCMQAARSSRCLRTAWRSGRASPAAWTCATRTARWQSTATRALPSWPSTGASWPRAGWGPLIAASLTLPSSAVAQSMHCARTMLGCNLAVPCHFRQGGPSLCGLQGPYSSSSLSAIAHQTS